MAGFHPLPDFIPDVTKEAHQFLAAASSCSKRLVTGGGYSFLWQVANHEEILSTSGPSVGPEKLSASIPKSAGGD